MICVSGTGVTKDFSCIMTDSLPDLELVGKSQCFPLYWYEENKHQQGGLFDDGDARRYVRRDGITDWILGEVRRRFGGTRAITKEHLFYYVYGVLHSPAYRRRFSADLKKSLPRIPIAEDVRDFMAFCKAGKELAALHLGYEQGINAEAGGQGTNACSLMAARAGELGVKVRGDKDMRQGGETEDAYRYFAVEKMRFARVRDGGGKLVADKSRIVYNGRITVEDIPPQAYEYVVNGKPAVEWVMERYAVTTDKASLVRNDPNDWSREHGQPRYVLDLLLSVVVLSCKTAGIIRSLPEPGL